MRRLVHFITIIVFVLIAVTTSSSSISRPSVVMAQTAGEELPPGVSADDVYRVSRKLFCEVCAGIPISDCPSPTCVRWRQEVAVLLSKGYSDDEIIQYFADNYGDEVSSIPIRKKERFIALALPGLAFLILGLIVVWQVWNLRRRSESRALQVAKAAGIQTISGRPVPDNVPQDYLDRFIQLIEDKP